MEVLPNELLIECLKYLDGLHIFESFDGLNCRFSTLIRHIPLYIDFGNVSTLKFFNIIFDPQIKKQIYSLKIRNQKQIVQSKIVIDGFVQLRSLSLLNIHEYDIKHWIINFSNLPQLCSFHMIDSLFNMHDILSRLPIFIVTMTVYHCTAIDVYDLLKYAIKLKYLNIHQLNKHISYIKNKNIEELPMDQNSISLKQLTFKDFNGDFTVIADILKRTPNLTVLILINYEDEKLFNIVQWEKLIVSSLTKLKSFNFTSIFKYYIEKSQIQDMFKKFQGNFWIKEHQWFTECIISNDFSIIYTIPYSDKYYTLPSYSKAFFYQQIDQQNKFRNVKSLKLYLNLNTNQSLFYFPYVTSIDIGQCCLTEDYFKSFKMTVNLTNLTNLLLEPSCELDNPLILLKILEQSSNISSLTIKRETLYSLLDNVQLSEYLSKTIKKLTLLEDYVLRLCSIEEISDYTDSSIEDFYQINKLWKTFDNIEQLECTITKRQSIRFLLKSLMKLSHLNIYSQTEDISTELKLFVEKISAELGIQINAEIVGNTDIRLSIDVIRKS